MVLDVLTLLMSILASVQFYTCLNKIKPYSTLLITSYSTLCSKDSLCGLVRRLDVSRKGRWVRSSAGWQLLGLAVKQPWLALSATLAT